MFALTRLSVALGVCILRDSITFEMLTIFPSLCYQHDVNIWWLG